MASADALVHGCEAETFCMAAAEARASGLPVIVPDRGGAADHADRAPSRRYRAGDVQSLRDAILGFVADRSAIVPRALDEAPRTMDMHFAELFQAYATLRSRVSRAA